MCEKAKKSPYLPIRLIPTQYCVHREDREKLRAEGWEWDERGQMFSRICGRAEQGLTAWRAFQDGGLPGPSLDEFEGRGSSKLPGASIGQLPPAQYFVMPEDLYKAVHIYELTAEETDADSVAPPVKTICVKCKHDYLAWGKVHLCEAGPSFLAPTTHPVTGETVYGPDQRTHPWPPCETINTGNCPHFEAKQ